LVCTYNTLRVTEIPQEGSANGNWWFLRLGQESPRPARGAVNDDEISTAVAVVGCNDTVRVLVWAAVVIGGSTHEAKVHEELRALSCNTFGGFTSSLLANVGLFFEVDQAKRVVFEVWGCTNHVLRKNFKLLFTRGPKS
jgi:hypothetical protein